MSTWPPTNPVGYMPKPSRYQRDLEKHERRQAKAAAKKAAEKQKALDWAKVARAAYDRDNGCSRASGKHLKFRTGSPVTIADPHHVVWLSRGGSDDLSNIVTVSRGEHDRIHMRGNYDTRLEVEGDANATLTFREYSMTTGRLIREWLSPNPSA